MRKVIACVAAMMLASTLSPASGVEKPAAEQNDSAASKSQPEPATYCTLLCSDKLLKDLHVTTEQRAELTKLQEQLKSSILHGGIRSQQHGPSTGKARLLAKMTDARLAYVGAKVKEVLTAEQDGKLTEFYASGKLRPIEVITAEIHDPNHGTKGKSFGEICLVPHYDDPAGKQRTSSGSATLGVVHGDHTEGSYYRESAKSTGATAEPGVNSRAPWNRDALLADIKSDNSDKRGQAIGRLREKKPTQPDPEVAKALESVLLEDGYWYNRHSAAAALETWGTPDSIPALRKALKDPQFGVRRNAEQAIKTLTDVSTPESQAGSADDIDTLLANLKKAGHEPEALVAALIPLERRIPRTPNPAAAEALETVLLENSTPRVRELAASALENWGRAESIPALQKAAKSSNPGVAFAAKRALKTLTDESIPGNQAEKAVERPVDRPAPRKRAERSPTPWDRDAVLADIKSDDSRQRPRAIMQLLGHKPALPDPAMAKALERVLLDDSSISLRAMAASALQTWGVPESIPALEKALKDPSKGVQTRAQTAIDRISARQ